MREPYLSTEPLQPLDVMVVLALASAASDQPKPTVRSLAAALEVSSSAVHRSLRRLVARSLVVDEPDGRRLNRLHVRNFLIHGVPWIAPAALGKIVLGVPTAHAASPLSERLRGDDDPVVIPLDEGPVRGRAVRPLVPSAGRVAARDPRLHELLAIVDGIRIGGAREREVATAELEARI
jgi:hypothetical protein